MDEVYRGSGEDSGPQSNSVEDVLVADDPSSKQFEADLQMVIEHAVSGGKQRIYQASAESPSSQPCSAAAPFQLNIKLIDQPRIGVTLTLNRRLAGSLYERCDPSKILIDDIKRKIVEDPYNASQLGLVSAANRLRIFQLGVLDADSGEFEEFDFSDSLQTVGISNNDTLYVQVTDGMFADNPHAAESSMEAQLRARINRINGRS